MSVEDKASAILAATLDLVAENGFHGTAMSKIAKHAGLSAGIIYHYFQNKDDLMQALYLHIKSELSAALIAGDIMKQPHPDYILALWRNAYNFYVGHPTATRFLEQFENSPYCGNVDIHQTDPNFSMIVARITADIQAGYIKSLPEWVIYDLTFGVAISVAKHVLAGLIGPSDKLLSEIAESCYRAIATQPDLR